MIGLVSDLVDGGLEGDFDEEEGVLSLSFDDKEKDFKIRGDNVEQISGIFKAINKILARKYELRVVTSSLMGDTFEFVVCPCTFWKRMEKQHGAKSVQGVFGKM